MNQTDFTHFDERGTAQMVDISDKDVTERIAVAQCRIRMNVTTKEKILERQFAKGDVLAISQIAGIMGAKKTSDIIPLCHPLPLTKVKVDFEWRNAESNLSTIDLEVTATVKVKHQTGVEMEALTACSVAALTVYDMCKSVDKGMVIDGLRLIHKSGGRSGTYSLK